MKLGAIGIVIVICAALPSGARAQRVTSELRAIGGYDSNPALASDPGDRRAPHSGDPPAPADGLFRALGFVAGRIGDDLSGGARFDLDGRVYGSGALLFWERLQIDGAMELEDLRLRCLVAGARLDATATDDDGWTGELECGALARLPLGFWLGADALGAVRGFDVGQLDGIGGGRIAAGWEHEIGLGIEVGLAVVRRESDDNQASRTDVAPWVAVRMETPWMVGGTLGYRLTARVFDSDSRSGLEHVGRLEVWVMPLPWIGGYAELEGGYAAGGIQALSYERIEVGGGVRLALDWQPPRSALGTPREQGPAVIEEDGRVRFSFDLPGASSVAVVGDWNDWDEARGALERNGARFEGRFALGPGRHEYQIVVDGEPRRPPGAPRYVDDDFGGANAIVEVPRAQGGDD